MRVYVLLPSRTKFLHAGLSDLPDLEFGHRLPALCGRWGAVIPNRVLHDVNCPRCLKRLDDQQWLPNQPKEDVSDGTNR